jgi:hypothetical protein
MALKDWPPQRIKRLWFRGMILEAALVAAPIIAGVVLSFLAPLDSRSNSRLLGPATTFQGLPTTVRDSLIQAARLRFESAGVAISIGHDTSTFRFNDSMSATLVSQADTLRSIHLSPAANRASERALTSFSRALSAVWWQLFFVIGLIYLPIPIALSVLTVAWRVQRAQAAT